MKTQERATNIIFTKAEDETLLMTDSADGRTVYLDLTKDTIYTGVYDKTSMQRLNCKPLISTKEGAPIVCTDDEFSKYLAMLFDKYSL